MNTHITYHTLTLTTQHNGATVLKEQRSKMFAEQQRGQRSGQIFDGRKKGRRSVSLKRAIKEDPCAWAPVCLPRAKGPSSGPRGLVISLCVI